MQVNLKLEINSLLSEFSVKPSDAYNQVIEEVARVGLTSNTEAMYGMNKLLFNDKKILAKKFYHHSLYEKMGGALICDVATKHAYAELQTDMLAQAKDEFKHAKMLESLIRYTGEDISIVKNEIALSKKDEELPDFKDNIRIFLCFVHAAEIRTLIMLEQYVAIIKHKKDDMLNNMINMLEYIKKDERQHAAYTAKYITKWIEEDYQIKDILLGCFLYTNKESLQEIASMAHELVRSCA